MLINIDSSIPKWAADTANTAEIADEIYRRVVNTAQSEDEARPIFAEWAARSEIIESHMGNTWPMTASTWPNFANVSP